VAVRGRRLSRATWFALAAAGVVALVCVLAWPYYSFTDLLAASGKLDPIHEPLYETPWLYFGLVVVTLPALWSRWRRERLDPLVVLFAGSAALAAIGWLTGRYAMGRVFPALMLAGQLALAVELARPVRRSLDRQRWLRVTAVACALGALVQASNLLYLAPRTMLTSQVRSVAHPYEDWPDYAWLRSYVKPRDVLLTSDYYASRTVGGYGVYTVVAWPDPFLDDEVQRKRDLAAMFDARTDPGTREVLLARYHVRFILKIPWEWAPVGGRTLVATGPMGQQLYRV
jgi:hypothetical protein